MTNTEKLNITFGNNTFRLEKVAISSKEAEQTLVNEFKQTHQNACALIKKGIKYAGTLVSSNHSDTFVKVLG
jgi:hypothetical protein